MGCCGKPGGARREPSAQSSRSRFSRRLSVSAVNLETRISMELLHNPEFGDKLVTLLAAQSFLLGAIAGAIAWYNHAPHIFIAAAMTVLLKAILVPILLERLVDRIDIHHEIAPIEIGRG